MEKLLIKLKLFDADKTLSLTNVALMVCVGKLAASPSPALPDLAALLLALLAYGHKKVLRVKADTKTETTAQALVAMQVAHKELVDRLNQLTTAVTLKNYKG